MQAAFSVPKVSAAPKAVRCNALPAPAVDRRQTFGMIAAGIAAIVAPAAQAIEIPSQASTGGQSGRGSIPPSSSAASASGYMMEGTKKMGVSVKSKKKILAKVKEQAANEAAA